MTSIPRPPCGGRRSGGWRFPQGEPWGYVPRPRARRGTIACARRRRQTDSHITKQTGIHTTNPTCTIPHPANCRPDAASTVIALRMQGTVLIAYGLAHRSTVATRTLRPPHGGRGIAAKVPGLPAGARMDGWAPVPMGLPIGYWDGAPPPRGAWPTRPDVAHLMASPVWDVRQKLQVHHPPIVGIWWHRPFLIPNFFRPGGPSL